MLPREEWEGGVRKLGTTVGTVLFALLKSLDFVLWSPWLVIIILAAA